MSRNGAHVLVYGGVPKGTWKFLKVIRRRSPDLSILPWHQHGTVAGIFNAAWRTLRYYLFPTQVKGSIEIDGICVDYLIKDAIRRDLRSGHFFGSMWLYNSARALAKRVKVGACVIPYENRSWEKMLVAGLSCDGNSIRTVGYHHAAVSPAHTNLLLGAHESQVIPLPDTIVMMGEVTKGILEASGNYPDQILKVGCALRQGRGAGRLRCRNEGGKVTNILVALASSVDEYVNTLSFLDAALAGDGRYKIGVRPHPEFSLDLALSRLPELGLKFKTMDGALDSNLDWADVVVYVSSTVGLDAISVGIPAVGIDLGKFVDYDPAPEDCPLKWTVVCPDQLVQAFQEIENISESEYRSHQELAVGFGKRYFHPVTDDSLRDFSSMVLYRSEALSLSVT